MANVTITQLPAAGAITGTESVPIVQNGVTVRTTTAALAGSPVQTQTFLTKNQEPTLNNSRALSNGTGVGLVDAGAQSTLTITLNAASGSLEAASNGMIAKTASNAVASRTMSSSTTGLSVTNGDGVAGNPTFALTGVALAVAGASGTGALVLTSSNTVVTRSVLGTTNQISVTDGDFANSPVIAISSNPVLPGTGGLVVPVGTTAQRGSATNGNFRYNSTTATFEGYANGAWGSVTTGTGVTSVAQSFTGGLISVAGSPITSTGTLALTVAGTSGGVPYFTSGTTWASSGALTANAIVLGGGAGAAPAPLASLGTTTTVLHGNAAGAPTFGAVSLTADVSGTLPIANGGTGATTSAGAAFALKGANTDLTSVALTTGTVSTTPSGSTDIANKSYVDTVAQGLDTKASCVAATTVNITLSAPQTIDGVSLVAGDRCLVKNQSTAADNGIYLVAAGSWTRALDMDTWAEVPGAYVFIETGTTQADTGWVCTSNAGGTIGVTAITWAQFSGAGSGVSSLNFGTTGLTPASATTGAITVAGTLAVANGGTGVTTSTGTGSAVLSASPTFTGTLAAAAITASTTLGVTGVSTLTGGATSQAKIESTLNFGTLPNVNFLATSGNTAQGLTSGYSFKSTFVGTGDNDPRRSADIWSGFSTSAWGTEYLAFGVGIGVANDGGLITTERMRINGAGTVSITATTEQSSTTGAMTVAGGVYIAKKLTAIGGISGGTF